MSTSQQTSTRKKQSGPTKTGGWWDKLPEFDTISKWWSKPDHDPPRWLSDGLMKEEQAEKRKYLRSPDVSKFAALSNNSKKNMDNSLQGLVNGLTDLAGMHPQDPNKGKMHKAFYDLLFIEPRAEESIGHIGTSSPEQQYAFAHSVKPGNERSSVQADNVVKGLLCRNTPDAEGSTDASQSTSTSKDSVTKETASRKYFRAQPDHISGLAYSLGILIYLCLYRVPRGDRKVNETSPYLDLSPLYGVSDKETETIRVATPEGLEILLAPDCFIEGRLEYLTPSVTTLLILFNRNHNYIARRLAAIKGHQWNDNGKKKGEGIFHCARSINCILFKDIVLHDFLRGVVGFSFLEQFPTIDFLAEQQNTKEAKGKKPQVDHCSIEFSLLYNFMGLISQTDKKWLDQYSYPSDNPEELKRPDNKVKKFEFTGYTARKLERNPEGRFQDEELAQVIAMAIQSGAGLPGARCAHSDWMNHMTATLKRSQDMQVCTLNEFRTYLGLKPYSSLYEWNNKPGNIQEKTEGVGQAAENIYGAQGIKTLDLYTGLLAEDTMHNGFKLGYTQSYGLWKHLITVICSDPRFTTEFNEEILTKWGYKYCASFCQVGENGSALPALILRNLPRCFSYNHTFAHFPLLTHQRVEEGSLENNDVLDKYESFWKDDQGHGRPTVVQKWDEIRHVLNSPNFVTPYSEELKLLTDGYGHMLGFNGTDLHDADQQMFLYSLMPDARTFRIYSRFFGDTAKRLLVERSRKHKEGTVTVDLVYDVVNPLCTQWVLETLCEEKPASFDSRNLARYLQDFSLLYAFVFKRFEPAEGWMNRRLAIEKSRVINLAVKERLSSILDSQAEARLRKPGWSLKVLQQMFQDISRLRFFRGYLRRQISQLISELTFGRDLNRSSYTFMERLTKTDDSVGKLPDRLAKLEEIKHLFEVEAHEVTEEDAEGIMNEALEKFRRTRLCANVVGLCVVMTVNYASACSSVVNFYLHPSQKDQRQDIIDIVDLRLPSQDKVLKAWIESLRDSPCQPFGPFPPSGTSSQNTLPDFLDDAPEYDEDVIRHPPEIPRKLQNFLLMNYVREAQRIDMPFGLTRRAEKTDDFRVISTRKGEHLFTDFGALHKDATLFPNPTEIDPIRDIYFHHGTGQCLKWSCTYKDSICTKHTSNTNSADSKSRRTLCEGPIKRLCYSHAEPYGPDKHICSTAPCAAVADKDRSPCKFHVRSGCMSEVQRESKCNIHSQGQSCQLHGFRPWSIQGLGMHKCPGLSFCDNTMPELLKAVFSLKDVKLTEGTEGIVKFQPFEEQSGPSNCSPGHSGEPQPMDPALFINEEGETSAYPLSLKIQFTPRKGPNPWLYARLVPRAPYPREVELLLIASLILYWFWVPYIQINLIDVASVLTVFSSLGAPTSLSLSKRVDLAPSMNQTCNPPTSVFRRWDISSILPGPDDRPYPIEYTLERPEPHILSLVDIDERDMQLAVYIDGILAGQTSEFSFDKRIWCFAEFSGGPEDCLTKGFSQGKFIVPAGKHAVRMVWVGKEFTRDNSLDWGHERTRRFMWQLENCS